jgi:hypothetical protein
MQRKSLLALAILATMAARCTSEPAPVSQAGPLTPASPSAAEMQGPSLDGCYQFVKGQDTAVLRLERMGDQFNGPLEYRWADKDRNLGSFSGQLENGILRGWYQFQSEGMTSVREAIFRQDENGNLLEGNGEIVQQGDSMRFRDPANLSYASSMIFQRSDCKAMHFTEVSVHH